MERLPDFLSDPLAITFIVIILLSAIAGAILKVRRARAWKAIAAETGLQFAKSKIFGYREERLEGVYRERPLALRESITKKKRSSLDRESGSSSDVATHIEIKLPLPQGVKLEIRRITVIGKLTKITHGADIDRRFAITSEPDWLAAKVLEAPNIREGLFKLKSGSRIFVFQFSQDTELCFRKTGRITNGAYLRFLLDFMSDLADTLEAAVRELPAVPDAAKQP